ncbi:cell division protein DrpB [Kluyvera cryocrescens]
MEERMNRGPGGRLALWVFYAFCGYFVWAMVRYVWVISAVETIPGATIDGEIGSTSGKWLGAILGFLLLSIVGALLGGILVLVLVRLRMKSGHNIAMLRVG